MVLVDPALPEGVAVRTRRGRSITDAVPGIAALVNGGRSFLLDGELVAAAGRASDFYALAPRLAGSAHRASMPVSFWAFDLLWLDGELLVDRPYVERRAALEGLPLAGPCGVVPRFPGADAHDLLVACVDHDVEGVVLKRLTSRYHPGERSRFWRTMCGGSSRCLRRQGRVSIRG
jgi:bifunctional non-homologous end joining protein LigD